MVDYSYLCGLRLCFRIRLIYRDVPVSPEWGVEPIPAPLEQEPASSHWPYQTLQKRERKRVWNGLCQSSQCSKKSDVGIAVILTALISDSIPFPKDKALASAAAE